MTTDVDPTLLPTVRQLVRATLAAAVLIVVLAVTVVLPAEEGIDPTGLGAVLGLTQMGALKNPAPPPEGSPQYTARTDVLTVTLAPGAGTEVKALMRQGDEITYRWTTDGPPLYFDFHGEAVGAAADDFVSYGTGSDSTRSGPFAAPFDGVHGWYWKSRAIVPVVVTLETTGVYASIGEPR